MSCHSPCACKRKALKVASDIRIINRKIHDAKFFMNFASLLGWLGKVVHSVRVFDSAWMLVLNSSCHGHLSSHRIKLRSLWMLICTACYPVLVLFPHWTVISICCSKTTPKYKREKNAHPTFVRLINWRWTQNSSTVAIMTQPFDGGCDRLATGRPSESRC